MTPAETEFNGMLLDRACMAVHAFAQKLAGRGNTVKQINRKLPAVVTVVEAWRVSMLERFREALALSGDAGELPDDLADCIDELNLAKGEAAGRVVRHGRKK